MEDIVQRVIDFSSRGDLYAVLGLAPLPVPEDSQADAIRRCTLLKALSQSCIKNAFVATSLACHPDKCKHPLATNAQTAVNKAWSVLKDHGSRKMYDVSFRAMVIREYAAKARQELLKKRNSIPAMAPRMVQQKKQEEQPKSAAVVKKAAAKKETSKTDTNVKKDSSEQEPKTWEVASYQLKELKMAVAVKLSSEISRKFAFKEWQDRKTARKIGEAFAREALRLTNQCDCLKLKKDKLAFVQKHGVIGTGACKEVEDSIRATFQPEIGATSVGEAAPITEGVTFNSFKNVFQASIKLDEQAYVKEFKTKADAERWIDIIKALHTKGLLKGHFDTLKKACANREATQKAFDSIINAKNVFTPESSSTWQYDPKKGTDTWASMFPKAKEVEEELPRSGPRSRERLMEEEDNAKSIFAEYQQKFGGLDGCQVYLDQADKILKQLKTRFRITVAKEAVLVREQMPEAFPDAFYGDKDAPLKGHLFYRWITDQSTQKVIAGHYDLLIPREGGNIRLPEQAPCHYEPSFDPETGVSQPAEEHGQVQPHASTEPQLQTATGFEVPPHPPAAPQMQTADDSEVPPHPPAHPQAAPQMQTADDSEVPPHPPAAPQMQTADDSEAPPHPPAEPQMQAADDSEAPPHPPAEPQMQAADDSEAPPHPPAAPQMQTADDSEAPPHPPAEPQMQAADDSEAQAHAPAEPQLQTATCPEVDPESLDKINADIGFMQEDKASAWPLMRNTSHEHVSFTA
eukprot:Skav215522  [mRNA]  locus=scaffold2213:106684:113665:- [translate_table: standard]